MREEMVVSNKRTKQHIAQLIFSGFPEDVDAGVLRARYFPYGIGGLVHFSRNIISADQLSALNADLRQEFDISDSVSGQLPLAIGVDQEGGRVQRIKAPICQTWPVAVSCDLSSAMDVGAGVGAELKQLGFNFDFAPVMDVVSPIAGGVKNEVIGDRAYSNDADEVAQCALAYARGLQSAGVLSCGKHFPGHGGPVADSHHEVPIDDRSLDELMRSDLKPFMAAVEYAVPMLMTAHVRYPQIDAEVVATYSRSIMSDLLRDTLGFTGVLITDDLDMAASTDTNASLESAAVRALRAGCDALLICHSYDRVSAVIDHLHDCAKRDEVLADRIHVAYERLKSYYRLLA